MRRLFMAAMFLAAMTRAADAGSLDIGPAVGSPIPAAFAVYDGAGVKKDLSALSGNSGAVLVFVRSASWCPYCIQQLRDIQNVAEPLKKMGYSVVSISYDAPEVLTTFSKKYAITYHLTSDRNSAMIDAFGIRDPQYKEGSRAFGVPMPGIFIVDRGGVVRAKLAEDGYKTRPPRRQSSRR